MDPMSTSKLFSVPVSFFNPSRIGVYLALELAATWKIQKIRYLLLDSF